MPNLSPASLVALGETIMPARSVSWAISGEYGLAERALKVHVALNREFCGLGVEWLAVMEFDARSEFDRHLLAVVGRRIGQRELRHDVQLFVDVEQLVAEGCKYDAAHVSAAHGRVEDIGVFSEPDAQRGLGGCLERQQQRCCGYCQAQNSHRSVPMIVTLPLV